jgi:hypothetical protein
MGIYHKANVRDYMEASRHFTQSKSLKNAEKYRMIRRVSGFSAR